MHDFELKTSGVTNLFNFQRQNLLCFVGFSCKTGQNTLNILKSGNVYCFIVYVCCVYYRAITLEFGTTTAVVYTVQQGNVMSLSFWTRERVKANQLGYPVSRYIPFEMTRGGNELFRVLL